MLFLEVADVFVPDVPNVISVLEAVSLRFMHLGVYCLNFVTRWIVDADNSLRGEVTHYQCREAFSKKLQASRH